MNKLSSSLSLPELDIFNGFTFAGGIIGLLAISICIALSLTIWRHNPNAGVKEFSYLIAIIFILFMLGLFHSLIEAKMFVFALFHFIFTIFLVVSYFLGKRK